MNARTKQHRETRQIEMVETYNIYLSLERIRNAPDYDSDRWKRALVHAISMSGCGSFEEKKKIREALGLP